MKKSGWFVGVLVLVGLIGHDGFAEDVPPPDSARTHAIVAQVRITGNRLTKEFIIQREMDLHDGDTVALGTLPDRLKANANRIFNTRLFVRVDVVVDSTTLASTAVTARPGTLPLLVIVKENWYIWPSPYARLNDRNVNEWLDRGRDLGRLNYGMYIGHTNLFGRMQRLEALGDVGFANRFTIRYNVPYLDRKGTWGLLGEVSYQGLANLAQNTLDNQLDFVYRDQVLSRQTEARLRLRRRQGFYVFHYADVSHSQVRIDGALRDINPFFLGGGQTEQRLTTLGYTYRFDNRDNINYSLKGRAFIGELRRVGLLPTDDFQSWQIRAVWADYHQLTKRPRRNWYASYLLRGQAFTNPDVPYNVLRGIGYDDDFMRGYDLYVVNGSAYGLARVNVRREVFTYTVKLNFIKWRQFNEIPFALYVNAFSDWGYVYNRFPQRLDNPLANRLLQSNGIGLEVSTWYNTAVRFNVSRNRLGETLFFMNLQKDISTRRQW